jgi:hypothetical protein
MLKATEYEILRGVKASGLVQIPLERQPVRVATLLDEKAFNEDQYLITIRRCFWKIVSTTGTGAAASFATTPAWPM